MALRGSKTPLWETLKQWKAVLGQPKSFGEYNSKYSREEWKQLDRFQGRARVPVLPLPPAQLPSPGLLPSAKAPLTHTPRQTRPKGKGTLWPAVARRLYFTGSPVPTCTGLLEVRPPSHVSHSRSRHPSRQDLCLRHTDQIPNTCTAVPLQRRGLGRCRIFPNQLIVSNQPVWSRSLNICN